MAKKDEPKRESLPQDPVDQHGPGYDNDTTGWVKGDGPPYPNFDSTKKKR